MDELLSIVSAIGYPSAYDHFAEGEKPAVPFVCFLLPESDHFSADGKVYKKISGAHIELYTDKKNPAAEITVENVLDNRGIYYEKSEVYISSERLYEVLYIFGLEE